MNLDLEPTCLTMVAGSDSPSIHDEDVYLSKKLNVLCFVKFGSSGANKVAEEDEAQAKLFPCKSSARHGTSNDTDRTWQGLATLKSSQRSWTQSHQDNQTLNPATSAPRSNTCFYLEQDVSHTLRMWNRSIVTPVVGVQL